MSSITFNFAVLILTILLLEWSDCKVLPLRREADVGGYGVRGYAPGRHRWFRSYGRGGYGAGEGGYGNGYSEGGYGNGYGHEGDGGFNREDYDIRNRENVKVNVKVYTVEDGQGHNGPDGYNA